MDDAKKVIGVFLIVLFIIILIGVSVSRLATKNANKPTTGGALERILFFNRPTGTQETIAGQSASNKAASTSKKTSFADLFKGKPAPTNTVVIKKTAEAVTPTPTQTPNSDTQITKGGTVAGVSGVSGETKGGQSVSETPNASNIPNTGTPAIIYAVAGILGFAGLKLRRTT